jgi:hypothetical protein
VAAKGRQIETEAAPIRYVAELLGADTDSERAIRWLIALMVLCCDPLAIALTAAASRHTNRQCSFIREPPAGRADVSAAAKDALAKSLKKDLSLIVERRNKIHRGDLERPFREHPGRSPVGTSPSWSGSLRIWCERSRKSSSTVAR